MKKKTKLMFTAAYSAVILAILTLSFGAVQAKSLTGNASKNALFARTAIHISGSSWGYIDGTTFDNASWVWASMANRGSVANREIPADAGVISIDVSASSVTATERTASEEVLTNAYERAVSVTTQRRGVGLGSSYQYLVFLPAGVAENIAADGQVTKAEVTGSEKLGSALVYTGSLDGNTVLGAVYLDGVLMTPESFNSRYVTGNLYSVLIGGDDSTIPNLRTFTTEDGANSFLASSARTPPCIDNSSLFFEHKKYGGWAFAVPVGFQFNLGGTVYDQNISSLRTAGKGNFTRAWDRLGFTGNSLIVTNNCSAISNLRDIGWNDRIRSIQVF